MSGSALRARLPARRVGDIVQARTGRVEWIPYEAWEKDAQHPRLGLDFLRTPGRRSTSGDLPAWFENLLPEPETALRARLCELHGLRDRQSFRLLAAMGHDLAGAVEVRLADGGHAVGDASDGLDADPSTELVAAPSEGGLAEAPHLSPLAGNQLKFTMSMDGERLSMAASSRRAHWIVKFPGAQYPELPEVEAATMSWARAAGFPVPEHRIYPFTSLQGIPPGWVDDVPSVFAIRRFDRRPDGTKIHHEDLCQALGLRPQERFGESGVSTEGALRLVVDACGEEDGRSMARRIGFMIASGNGDAHLKNWGLVWGDSIRPSLSPCYDLVSTISWERLGWVSSPPRLALKLGGARRFSEIDADRLGEAAVRAGHPWVATEIRTGIALAREAWRGVDVAPPQRMHAALVEHWRRVPILRESGSL